MGQEICEKWRNFSRIVAIRLEVGAVKLSAVVRHNDLGQAGVADNANPQYPESNSGRKAGQKSRTPPGFFDCRHPLKMSPKVCQELVLYGNTATLYPFRCGRYDICGTENPRGEVSLALTPSRKAPVSRQLDDLGA